MAPTCTQGDGLSLKCSPILLWNARKTQRRAPPRFRTTGHHVLPCARVRRRRGAASTPRKLQTRDAQRSLCPLRGEPGARRQLWAPGPPHPKIQECDVSEDRAGRLGPGGCTVAPSFKLFKHQDVWLEEGQTVLVGRKEHPAPWRSSAGSLGEMPGEGAAPSPAWGWGEGAWTDTGQVPPSSKHQRFFL